MLPFFLGIAVVSIFADDNDLLIKGLEPASSLDPPLPSIKALDEHPEQHPGITKDMLPNLFKRLVFDIATFAPGTFACSDIVVTQPTGAIACERKTVLADQGGDGGAATFCRLSLTCTVGADLRGEQNVAVSFPSAFQNIQWIVQPDAWNGLDIVSKVNHTLMERNHLLTGTPTNPTTLNFGLTRSRYRDLRGGLDDTKTLRMYGLQVSWLGETKQLSEPDEPDTADGRHHVVFALDVQESVFESERSDRVNFPTRLGTVLTLMLSAIGIMRVVKALLGFLIDVCLVRRAKKTGHAAPSDVDRRLHILNEKFLTETADMDHHQEETAARRLSQIGSFRQPKKQRRLSSRDLMQQDKTKPKKQRRLSSRELMQQEKNNTSADDIGIEMREFGFESSNGNVVYSNPLKKNAAGRGRRRHSSTSLSAFEEKTVKTKGAGGGEGQHELEQKVKNMELKFEEQSREHREEIEQMKQQITLLLSMVATSPSAPVNRETTEEDGDIEYFHDEESNQDYYIDADGETQWKSETIA